MAQLPNITSSGVLAVLAIQLGACARYQHYQPAPLARVDEARDYNARRLNDSTLTRVLAAHGVPESDSAWDSRQIAIAALYFRPDIMEAQLALAAARAGEITAGVRPYPSVTVTTNRAARTDEGHSTPWSFSLTVGLTLERGGKRGARIARARAATLAARLSLESTAWKAIGSARLAAAAVLGSDVDLADAHAELEQVRTVFELLRGRYGEGQIGRAELARSETDVQVSAVGATQAAGARTDARSALTRELAVPPREVAQLYLRPDSRTGCIAIDSLPLDSLETLSLRTLATVGAALADYAIAEADLRIQIAQQYPDVILGPGIAWEQGVRRWILSLGFPSIAIDRARGPIAEAVAHRAVQAARVRLVQDSVLASIDSSVATCQHAHRAIASADSLVRSSGEEGVLAEAAFQRGEIGRTELAFAQLALLRAQRARHRATQRALAAGVALENATGLWLSGPPMEWRDLTLPRNSDGASGGIPPEHR